MSSLIRRLNPEKRIDAELLRQFDKKADAGSKISLSVVLNSTCKPYLKANMFSWQVVNLEEVLVRLTKPQLKNLLRSYPNERAQPYIPPRKFEELDVWSPTVMHFPKAQPSKA
jgi:hypothetical protein